MLSTSVKDDLSEASMAAATRIKSAPTVLETIESVPSTPMPSDAEPSTARPVLESEASTDTEIGPRDADAPNIDAAAPPEAEGAVEPASDASSVLSTSASARSRSQDTRSVVSARSERSTSGVGEWMGTLWSRRKPKETDAESESNADKDEPLSVEPERTRSAPAIGTVTSVTSAADGTENTVKTQKDKERRSVFGSLGLSLFAGSGARKKRPALSADYTPPPSGPSTAVEPTFPTEITSPEFEIAPPSVTPATISALPTTTSSPAESTTATAIERPPQGATIPALVAATRVMTADASSILIDIDVAPSIAEAALQLIQHVRDTELDVRKATRPRQHKRKSSLAAKLQQLQVPGKEDPAGQEKDTPNKRLGVAATMASVLPTSGFASPLLGSFLPQQRRLLSNAPAASSSGAYILYTLMCGSYLCRALQVRPQPAINPHYHLFAVLLWTPLFPLRPDHLLRTSAASTAR